MVVAARALAELRLVSVFARIPPPTQGGQGIELKANFGVLNIFAASYGEIDPMHIPLPHR